MPKRGMEPIRRAALIDATIAEIGARGSLDVTVGQIAKRAGVSSGLAHHYFGGKDDILLAAMRHILRTYRGEVVSRLAVAETPWARIDAIVAAGFAPSNFRADTVAAWLNFYVLALSSDDARRLHRVYAGRLRSTLAHAIRGVLAETGTEQGSEVAVLADRTAQLIDGAYLTHGLNAGEPDAARATRDVLDTIRAQLEV